MNKMFFSQTVLGQLAEEGKIQLDKNILTLPTATDSPSYELEPAYKVKGTADGSPDPYGLTGQIKYERELKAEQAEVYLDSLIYRDTAYIVEPGFIGEKKELLDRLSDSELLARFLLDTLI